MWEKQLFEKMRLEIMTYEILLPLDFLKNIFKEEILQNPVSPKIQMPLITLLVIQ